MVCLETDFLIALFRNDSAALSVASKLREEEDLQITIFSVCELLVGLHNLPEQKKKFDALIENSEILYPSIRSAEIYAGIRNYLSSKGKEIPVFDLLIASVCLSASSILLTRDGHFSRIRELKTRRW